MLIRRLVAGVVMVSVFALSSCSDDEASSDPGDPTATPSQTATAPTQTPAGPSIPIEAQGTDEASAKAFVRFYFATLSAAMTSGDISAIPPLSDSTCQSCKSIPGRIDNIYDRGGRLDTEGWRVQSLISDPTPASNRKEFLLRVKQSPSTLLDADGTVLTRTGAKITPMRIRLRIRGESWVVERLDFIR
jgi:hypothetical protein